MTPEEQEEVLKNDQANVVDLRFVVTDKAADKRAVSTTPIDPEIKARLVSKGFQDKDVLAGKLKTAAPTLPNEVMNVQLAAAQTYDHLVEQGDVEAAFLNSPLMQREVFLRVPKTGLPAVNNMRALKAGELLRCRRTVYGFNDAPVEWHQEHRSGILETGAQASGICPTLYLYYKCDRGNQAPPNSF